MFGRENNVSSSSLTLLNAGADSLSNCGLSSASPCVDDSARVALGISVRLTTETDSKSYFRRKFDFWGVRRRDQTFLRIGKEIKTRLRNYKQV